MPVSSPFRWFSRGGSHLVVYLLVECPLVVSIGSVSTGSISTDSLSTGSISTGSI